MDIPLFFTDKNRQKAAEDDLLQQIDRYSYFFLKDRQSVH
jgi:hypothetical protein